MDESAWNDNTEYKVTTCGHYHNNGDIKTRKKWNAIYMIDVKHHEDFVKVNNDEAN